MKWTPGGRSPNLEDRRARGGGGGRRGLGVPLGVGGGVLITLILALMFGRGVLSDSTLSSAGGEVGLTPADSAREEPMVQFVSFVLDDAQSTWAGLFGQRGAGGVGGVGSVAGVEFRPAKLVLFRDGTISGCGPARSAMGPFYCPLDETVYLDLGFFEELDRRFGAPGDFAQAYVIAHELGHHVQHLTGVDARVRDAQRAEPSMANQYSVRLELQADCYAGVWAHFASRRGRLERGDVSEGLTAASAVGDDRIRSRETGGVNVDAFTHGSARERVSWFARGLGSGDPKTCATFGQ